MRRLCATIARFFVLSALAALTGCGNGRAFEQAQAEEKAGSYHKAYDQYCRAAGKHPGNGDVAAAIRRVRPHAAMFWAEHAQQATDAGRYDDAWRMWMRVLNIEPTHEEAVTRIHELEQNHFLAIRDAKADYLERGATTLAVSIPDETETQLAAQTETSPPAEAGAAPVREPTRIASVPDRQPQEDTTKAEPPETQITMARPISPVPAPSSDNAVANSVPTMPKPAPKIIPPARPLPRIANASPAPSKDIQTPRVNTLVPERASEKPATPARGAAVIPPPAPVPETADLAHADEPADEPKAAAPADAPADIAEHLAITETPSDDEAITQAEPSPAPRIATTADQKEALATSTANVPPRALPGNGNGESHGFGDFLVLRTLSREDKQFPKFARLIDGVDAKLKDTDDDLDADINLYIGNKRIKKIRELGMDRPVVFHGESGKRYKLLILGIRHSTHTVRLGIKPA